MFGRGFGVAVLLLGILGSTATASSQQDLTSAAKHHKVAFILVTDQGTPGVDQARDVIRQAVKRVPKSTSVELIRTDPANAQLVQKLGVAGAPVPVILVAARNGAIAGGLVAAQATPEALVGVVPSPKKADVLLALEDGKSVFIAASRQEMSSQDGTLATCAAACNQMSDKCVMVQIDMADPAETAFLTQLKVNTAATEPVTVVVNPQGQVTATYKGATDVSNLVQAATRKAGGCCPSTVQSGSKACAPAKK
jgi:hypothetical protein